jgi:hypothetical protein
MRMTAPPINGNCVGHPTSWWYPLVSNRSSGAERQENREGAKKAIAICLQCEVREQCLTYSLEWEPTGIWGGLPENDRGRMRRRLGVRLLRQSATDILGYPPRV